MGARQLGFSIALGVSIPLLAATQRPAVPPQSAYRALVEQYRTGDADAAVAEIAAMRPDRITAKIVAEELPGDFLPQAAAAALHTEAALRQAISPDLHLDLAQAVIAKLDAARFDPQFRRAWYLAAVSAWLQRGRWDRAGVVVEAIPPEFANDADILVAMGSWLEASVPGDAATAGVAGQMRLETAVEKYRAALRANPRLVEARLRLGRVLARLGQRDEAITHLEGALRDAMDTELVYLATLFLGQAREEAARPDRALEHFRAAFTLVPTARSAGLALSRLLIVTGRRDEASEVARRMVAVAESAASDPLQQYVRGQLTSADARAALLRGIVRSSPTGGDTPAPQQATFRSTIDAVRLDVTVRDDQGPVTGLQASDFEILDNGVPQVPELVANVGGLTVLPLLDTSGSVEGDKLKELTEAARALAANLRPDDRAGLATFSDQFLLKVPISSGANHTAAIANALGTVHAGGFTSLYDALSTGLALLGPDAGGALLLVFSDGVDSASQLSAAAVLDAVKRSDIVVGVVVTSLPPETSAQPRSSGDVRERLLQSVVDATGGTLLRAEFGGRRLGDVFIRLLDQFRTRTVLSYTPRCVGRNDGWHTLTVRLKTRVGVVRARNGYFASNPAGGTAPCEAAGEPTEPRPVPSKRAPVATVAAPIGSDYLSIVHRYQTGDYGPAVLEMLGWTRARVQTETGAFERAVGGLLGGPKGRLQGDSSPANVAVETKLLAAAVLLHTETAARQESLDVAQAHLEAARRLLDRLKELRFDAGFRRDWFLLAESCLRWRADIDSGRMLGEARTEFGADPEVLLALGSLHDVSTRPPVPNALLSRTTRDFAVQATSTRHVLLMAESYFRDALKAAPSLLEARLRLGRVEQRLGRADQAAVELSRVRAESKDVFTSYLAALFLGQLHEEAGRATDAAECYRAAIAIVPDAQSASVALAHLLIATGDTAAATGSLSRVLSRGVLDDAQIFDADPWWQYDMGQVWRIPERVARMRQAVAR